MITESELLEWEAEANKDETDLVDAKRILDLIKEVKRLQEFEWMYRGFCK